MLHIAKPLIRRPLMPLLIMLQVAFACAISCNTLFLLQQKLEPILAPTGVSNPSHLIVLSQIVPKGKPWPPSVLHTVQNELLQVSGVESATAAATFPMVGKSGMVAEIIGPNPGRKAGVAVFLGNNLVNALGLHLVEGRDFSAEEEAMHYGNGMGFHSNGPVIITRALAERLFPDGHALGRRVNYVNSPGGSRVVIGVVDHLLRNQFDAHAHELGNVMLFPGVADSWPYPVFAVRVAPQKRAVICKPLRHVIESELGSRMMPGQSMRCDSFLSLHNEMLAQSRAAVWLLASVTLIVLIVTLAGIVGMTGHWIQQRMRSIGIHRALGARRADILHWLLLENLLLVGTGVVLGLVVAYGINLWMMRHFELTQLPLAYLAIGAAPLIVLGQLSVLSSSLRASRVQPASVTCAN